MDAFEKLHREAFNAVSLKDKAHTIAIGFDGVLHNNNKGFHNGTIYGQPIHGAAVALQNLSKQFSIIIFTTKAKEDRPLVNGRTGKELVWEWLEKHGMSEHIQEVTAEKPRASWYIENNAMTFDCWDLVMWRLAQ